MNPEAPASLRAQSATRAGSAPDPAPRVWVLNLDAEHELEAAGRPYQPTARLLAIVARESAALLGGLVAPGDLVLAPGGGILRVSREGEGPRVVPAPAEAARGLAGQAWCPTPRARQALAAAGARPPEAPPLAVLAAVNARPFAAAVRAPLAGASFAKTVAATFEDALAALARPAAEGWLVRRSFGAAGRGRRRMASISARRALDPAERAWLAAGLRRGPLVIEPWVQITREYTRSGGVRADGSVFLSGPCLQETTAAGAWTRSEPTGRGGVGREDDARLAEAFESAGRALFAAGYTGPFGVDAYRHRDDGGREVLNPLSEINARYTMDWAAGAAGDWAAGAAGDWAASAAGDWAASAAGDWAASAAGVRAAACDRTPAGRVAELGSVR